MFVTDVLVLDASAVVFACTEVSDSAEKLMRRLSHVECHAPHLVDAEVGHTMRNQVIRGVLTPQVATAVIRTSGHLVDHRYPHTAPLAEAAWALRGAITFYDALYVALAARLDVPLLTGDARLTRAPALPCAVELVA